MSLPENLHIAELPTRTVNPNGGPNTEQGKAVSSRNAVTHGLFAAHDFIRDGEQPAWTELAESLRVSLVPEGPLELNLVAEMLRAMWRLRRCGLIEEGFASAADSPDPMLDEAAAKTQLAVDRARSQAHRLLHKCTAELRQLQTERRYRHEFFEADADTSKMGICNTSSIRSALDKQMAAQQRREKLTVEAEIDAMLSAPYPPPGSFCKTVPVDPAGKQAA